MKEYGTLTLFNMDCLELMKESKDNHFDLAIVDPPYGISICKTGYVHSKTRKVKQRNGSVSIVSKNDQITFPDEKPSQEYFSELFRVSKNQIIWGGNHLSTLINKNSSCWIVWDKINGKSSFADCELAWTSFKKATRLIRYMWSGMLQASPTDWTRAAGNRDHCEKRIHATQKPVNLYKWILQEFAFKGDSILDTHLGSGSIALACRDMGFDLTGCEIDTKCFNKMKERIKTETAQQELF